MKISSSLYFGIFVFIQIIPLIFVVILAYEYFPNGEHIYLQDQQVADILGLNLTEGILLNGYAPNSVFKMLHI
jgi:hypothetical protein